MADPYDRRRLPGNQNLMPRRINATLADAADAERFGYSNLVRGFDGSIISGTDPSGRQVPFVGGQAPERHALNLQAGAAAPALGSTATTDGSSLRGGSLGPSTARQAMDQAPTARQTLDQAPTARAALDAAPTARQALDNVPPPAAANPPVGTASPAPTVGPSARNGSGSSRAASSQPGTFAPMMTSLSPNALDALEQARGFKGTSFEGMAPSSAPVAPPSIADSYRSGSNYDTARATNDFAAGRISQAQLKQVQDAASTVGNAQGIDYSKQAVPARNAAGYITSAGATNAANAEAERLHPSSPYGLIAEAPAPNGGGNVVAPSNQPQTSPADGGAGIYVNGVPQNKNGTGTFVAGAPAATPGTSTVNATPGTSTPPELTAPAGFKVSNDVQKALVAKNPSLGQAGTDQHAQFLKTLFADGNPDNAASIADRLFSGATATASGNAGGVAKDAAFPAPVIQTAGTAPVFPGAQPFAPISTTTGPTTFPTDKMDAAGISATVDEADSDAQAASPVATTLKSGVPQPTATGFPGLDQTVDRATAGIANLGSTIAATDVKQPMAASTPDAVNDYARNNPTIASTVTNPNASPAAPSVMVGGYNIAAYPGIGAAAAGGLPGTRNLFGASAPGSSPAPANAASASTNSSGGTQAGSPPPASPATAAAGTSSASQPIARPTGASAASSTPAAAGLDGSAGTSSGASAPAATATAKPPTDPLTAEFGPKALTLSNTAPGAPSGGVGNAFAGMPPLVDPDELRRKQMASAASGN